MDTGYTARHRLSKSRQPKALDRRLFAAGPDVVPGTFEAGLDIALRILEAAVQVGYKASGDGGESLLLASPVGGFAVPAALPKALELIHERYAEEHREAKGIGDPRRAFERIQAIAQAHDEGLHVIQRLVGLDGESRPYEVDLEKLESHPDALPLKDVEFVLDDLDFGLGRRRDRDAGILDRGLRLFRRDGRRGGLAEYEILEGVE